MAYTISVRKESLLTAADGKKYRTRCAWHQMKKNERGITLECDALWRYFCFVRDEFFDVQN